MQIENLQNENRKYAKSIGNFHVLEYVQDASVSPMNAMNEYFMSKMNVRRRQVVIDIDKDHSAVIQAGSMQWMGGNVQATSGVKGIGDFLGKALKGAVTKETAVKPEYVGEGCLVLEPTYKYIILADIGKWGSAGMTIEDGMFLACDANVKSKVVTFYNILLKNIICPFSKSYTSFRINTISNRQNHIQVIYIRFSCFCVNKTSHILSYYTRPKWHKRESCYLEKLLSKWNSNYRNAPNATHYQVSKCHFPAKKYNPYKIYQKRKHAISIHDFFSKRPECQGRKFKTLQAYRNSNNCNTPYASCKNPGQAAQ